MCDVMVVTEAWGGREDAEEIDGLADWMALLIMALGPGLVPALRESRVHPSRALRYE